MLPQNAYRPLRVGDHSWSRRGSKCICDRRGGGTFQLLSLQADTPKPDRVGEGLGATRFRVSRHDWTAAVDGDARAG
jgi:hypothetical protein